MKTTTIQWPDIRAEAKRLNGLGALRVTVKDRSNPRNNPFRGRCVGFAVDYDERDCLIFRGPYGMQGRFVNRCIPAERIEQIEILGGAPVQQMEG